MLRDMNFNSKKSGLVQLSLNPNVRSGLLPYSHCTFSRDTACSFDIVSQFLSKYNFPENLRSPGLGPLRFVCFRVNVLRENLAKQKPQIII